MDVLDTLDLRDSPPPRRTRPCRTACGCRRTALERAEHQFAADITVEADPVDVGQGFADQGDALAMLAIGSGSPAASPRAQPARSRYICALSAATIWKSYISRIHFPAPRLDRPALHLDSTRRALAARLGRVARRLASIIWASAIIFASRARASVRLASWVRNRRAVISARPRWSSASGDALEFLISLGVEPEREHV